ncbi:MAG: cytochrome c-type biogenesis protein CcmH [Burkholderiales bacterium]|jgi:cytochrome c-type biogenesis protein CcmH|nr:cytochrome c-type biogenesis protein CcmH [Burkholderiales bacterium]
MKPLRSMAAFAAALLLGLGAPLPAACAQGEAKGIAGTTTARPTENDPVVAKREHDLAKQLRCLVCQNETIADSRADLAVDLRRQVREQIAAGRSDTEIINFMTDRYGDFVLYKPPLQATTIVLWFGPFLLLAAGAWVAWRVVRARRNAPAPAPLTDEQRARAAAMLDTQSNPSGANK